MDNELNVETKMSNQSTEKITSDDEDYIVKCVGAFGMWQAGICFVAMLTRFMSMWNMFSMLFLTPATSFKCVKFESNVTMDVENSTCYDSCVQYDFHKDIFDETLVSEFGLICENAWMASLSQTILMFGLLLGVFLFGWISDSYGRRKALISSSFINATLMLIVPFSPSYWIFILLRFLIGVASGGTLTIGVVYILEIVGPRYRETAGVLALTPDGLAEASLPIFAYYSSNWRIYSMGYAVVSAIIAILMFLIPESPRWLISKGQTDNAIEVLRRIAKFNKQNTLEIESEVKYAVRDITGKEISKPSYLDFLKFKINVVAITIIWIAAGACFFGINEYVTFLGNDSLSTVVLLGFIQMPTGPVMVLMGKFLGRKIATIISLLTIGISMTTIVFLPQHHWACKYLGIVGFVACSGLFDVIYYYTGELFPTSIRNMAYGLSTAGSKIGSMVVPFVLILNPFWVPSLIFAAMVFISSFFCLLLPETKGRKLEDYA